MIPRYAPVAPLNVLRRFAASMDVLGSYQLLIAPLILEQADEYAMFFRDVYYDQFVIVDNGVIELGYPLRAADLYRAARAVDAQLVVMPDTIDDARMTLKQTERALADFRTLDHYTDTMGVVQGTSFEECMACAKSLVELGVDWLAVPRGLTPHLGTRVPLVEALAAEYEMPMHILGFSDNIADDIQATTVRPDLVRGIDAATPIWTRQWLPRTPPSNPEFSRSLGRRPPAFWFDPPGEFAMDNVRTVRQWLNDATIAHIERAEQSALKGQ